MASKQSKILLNAVTATGAGTEVLSSCENSEYFTFYIKAASVTTGATLEIQSLAPNGTDWHRVGSAITLNANGNTIQQITGRFTQLRANITARTDGTYTISVECR